jgi:hypothetical protein
MPEPARGDYDGESAVRVQREAYSLGSPNPMLRSLQYAADLPIEPLNTGIQGLVESVQSAEKRV